MIFRGCAAWYFTRHLGAYTNARHLTSKRTCIAKRCIKKALQDTIRISARAALRLLFAVGNNASRSTTTHRCFQVFAVTQDLLATQMEESLVGFHSLPVALLAVLLSHASTDNEGVLQLNRLLRVSAVSHALRLAVLEVRVL